MRVLSLLPKSRFTESGVDIPEALHVQFPVLASSHMLLSGAENADALLVPPSMSFLSSSSPIDAFCLRRMPSVRFIQSTGAGYDSVDHLAAAELGIPVANSPGMNAGAVAEYVFSVVVALQRGLLRADREIRAGRFASIRNSLLQSGCQELSGCRVGLVGLGETARALVPLLRALDCEIVANDIHWPEDFASEWDITRLDLKELFSSCDVVSLHCPLLESTRNLVDARLLSCMKPESVLVNAARGGIINETELAQALEERRIRGVALDCFAEENPAPDNPLLHLSDEASGRILFSPHLAGVTRKAFGRMLEQALENLESVLIRGCLPKHVVNGISLRGELC